MSRFWIENAQLAEAEVMSRAMILVGGYAVDPSEETARELKSAIELHSRIDPGAALLVLVRTPANDPERALLAGLPETALPRQRRCLRRKPICAHRMPQTPACRPTAWSRA